VKQIARLAGLSPAVVTYLLYGKPSEGAAPAQGVRPSTAAALLAVRALPESFADYATVDGTGTRRRLQALSAVGWSISSLGRELGVSPGVAHRYVNSVSVKAVTAARVKALYDRLWDVAPPESTKGERVAASHARGNAARRGWPLPMAWDDETIDDPAGKPSGAATEQSTYRKLPEGEELLVLVDEQGETHQAIADRFEVKVKSVKSALIRARKKATSQNLETTS
jgi:hypothetical protein